MTTATVPLSPDAVPTEPENVGVESLVNEANAFSETAGAAVSTVKVADVLAPEWPRCAHPERPEFLLTTQHRHGTSGFFIARLRAR